MYRGEDDDDLYNGGWQNWLREMLGSFNSGSDTRIPRRPKDRVTLWKSLRVSLMRRREREQQRAPENERPTPEGSPRSFHPPEPDTSGAVPRSPTLGLVLCCQLVPDPAKEISGALIPILAQACNAPFRA